MQGGRASGDSSTNAVEDIIINNIMIVCVSDGFSDIVSVPCRARPLSLRYRVDTRDIYVPEFRHAQSGNRSDLVT